MKLSKKERFFILKGRERLKIWKKSQKITRYRKAATQSNGEKRISEFLKQEGIVFKREYFFTDCYSPYTKHLLYFDFWLPDYNLAIEYDGQQHYGKEKTESQKINDFAKNAYCLKSGKHLLRIKYTDFENIEVLICKKIDKIDPVCL